MPLTPSPTRSSSTTYSLDGRTFGPYGFDSRFPRLVAFDLDYTLWSGWIDTHYSAPFTLRAPIVVNSIYDMNGKCLSFYPHIARILHRLQESQTHIAATSTTQAPQLTREALALLLVPPPTERPRERPQRAIDFFESLEIYPESKRVHFSEMHKKTDIPYSEMLFFGGDPYSDAENHLVERLGVTYIPVKSKLGLTLGAFEEGVREWRRRRGWAADDSDDDDDDDGDGTDMDISSDEEEEEEDEEDEVEEQRSRSMR
ncbi:hypothetical protein FRB94_000595 [Tulasnella sp. JGI-2019a]|nr:hypothetical protein FRB93_013721 [Tulasnella sp. JGI-2019a]KAG9006578.1 hypothetical protein FRB94_000595 [Tulasnella sp. JGI-2019a]